MATTSMPTLSTEPKLVDWDVAVATVRRLAKPGPEVTAAEARAVVAELRGAADEATDHVREFTGLDAGRGTAPVMVIDRVGWAQANCDAFADVLAPLADKVAERMNEKSNKSNKSNRSNKSNKSNKESADTSADGPTGGGVRQIVGSARPSALGAKLAGVEAGGLLAYLSARVLGQFDPFYESADGTARGRLLLVAPNVVTVERELQVDPHDFRRWVCLHEETHRVQFTAVPWMRDFLRERIHEFVAETELEPSALASRLREAFTAIVGSLRSDDKPSIVELVQTPRQREILETLTGVMSLLEGHAEYVMDGVGPAVVPSVSEIRAKFQKRRAGTSKLDQVVRRVLGLEMKMAQYRDGEKFVRAVVDDVGRDVFNRVWSSPDSLPTKAEIGDPALWLARVGR